MKTLIVIRHAKSTWNNPLYNDFERPLTERGHTNAKEMQHRLSKKKLLIDAYVSSPAFRALSTAIHFANGFGLKDEDIITVPELYQAEPITLFKVISNLPDNLNCVAVFSHNPGITDFVNELTSVTIDHMPTCGIYAIHTHINSWKEFPVGPKEFFFFDYPEK